MTEQYINFRVANSALGKTKKKRRTKALSFAVQEEDKSTDITLLHNQRITIEQEVSIVLYQGKVIIFLLFV